MADGQALLQDPGTRPWPSWLAWPGTTRSGSKQSSLYRPLTTFLQDYSVIAAEREIMPRFFCPKREAAKVSVFLPLSMDNDAMDTNHSSLLALISSIYFVLFVCYKGMTFVTCLINLGICRVP